MGKDGRRARSCRWTKAQHRTCILRSFPPFSLHSIARRLILSSILSCGTCLRVLLARPRRTHHRVFERNVHHKTTPSRATSWGLDAAGHPHTFVQLFGSISPLSFPVSLGSARRVPATEPTSGVGGVGQFFFRLA